MVGLIGQKNCSFILLQENIECWGTYPPICVLKWVQELIWKWPPKLLCTNFFTLHYFLKKGISYFFPQILAAFSVVHIVATNVLWNVTATKTMLAYAVKTTKYDFSTTVLCFMQKRFWVNCWTWYRKALFSYTCRYYSFVKLSRWNLLKNLHSGFYLWRKH